jgi:hypothetical protein
MTDENIYTGSAGILIYRVKPEGVRVASRDDFFDKRGIERIGFNFLLHTYYSNNYEVHKAKQGSYAKFQEWIEDGRVFVK